LLTVERASAAALESLVTTADSDRLVRWLMETALLDAPASWRAAWRRDAACANSDLDYFASDGDVQAECLAVCASCRVTEQCLAASRHAPDPWYGIAGGRTGEQRRAEDRETGARPGWRRPARVVDAPRSCACGCDRPVQAGQGRVHPACRQRQARERRRQRQAA
jgi:hypothetical protein